MLHTAGINSVLTESLLSRQEEASFEAGTIAEANLGIFPAETQCVPPDYIESDRLRREQAMSILCGRWSSGKRNIEISRAGDHFILTHLKRNGSTTDERHILVWLDRDILYYGHENRITALAHNRDNGVLMLSPGVDYTRIPEETA